MVEKVKTDLETSLETFNDTFKKYIDSKTTIDDVIKSIDDVILKIEFEYKVNTDDSLLELKSRINDIRKRFIISKEINTIAKDDIQINKLNNLVDKIVVLFIDKNERDKLYREEKDNIQNILPNLQNIDDKNEETFFNYWLSKIQIIFNYSRTYCVSLDNNILFNLMINISIFETFGILFSNLNNQKANDTDIKYINQIILLTSYLETNIRNNKKEITTLMKSIPKPKEIIIDICQFIMSIINNYLTPLDINLQLKKTKDPSKTLRMFDKYLIDHIKIYNPSPCKDVEKMEIYKNELYATREEQNYDFYSFSSDNEVYYYSIFYKINTAKFLNPSDPQNIYLLDEFDLHQCLIMNSMFNGSDQYKYGKFLRFLNEILFPRIDIKKMKIICFVDNTKTVVDALFDFLNSNELFEITTDKTKNVVTQNINVETYQCKYVKYDNISFYTKQNKNDDDEYINLILEKFK